MNDKKYKVYIAGPYTNGDTAANVGSAIKATSIILNLGHTPFCPHLSHYIHMFFPMEHRDWLEYDLEWLKVCDILLRLPGDSPGAEHEVTAAYELGMPVVYSMSDLEELILSMEGKRCKVQPLFHQQV